MISVIGEAALHKHLRVIQSDCEECEQNCLAAKEAVLVAKLSRTP